MHVTQCVDRRRPFVVWVCVGEVHAYAGYSESMPPNRESMPLLGHPWGGSLFFRWFVYFQAVI